jgi:branched-chain amino acid transport system substrate-binding protein
MLRKVFLWSFFVFVLVMVSPWNDGQAQTDVKIGTIFPLTGPLALLGNESFEASDLAREMVNEKFGGVWGKKVVFVKSDAPDPTSGANEANRLITHEGMKILIGTYSSSIALAASAVAERNKVIFLEVIASSDEINQRGHKYTFRTNESASDLGGTAAVFASEVVGKELKIDPKKLRVVIFHEDSAYGTSVGKGVKKTADRLGLNVLAYDNYKATSVDLSSIVLRFRSLNPDVIIATSYINDSVLFWKTCKQLGLRPKALIGTSAGYGIPDFARLLGPESEGVFTSEAPALVNPAALSEKARGLDKEFRDRWMKKKGRLPAGHAYRAFTGTWVLLTEVLPKAGAMDPEKIRQAFLKVDLPYGSLPHGLGVKYLPPEDPNAGLNERRIAGVQQWQDGKIVQVWPEKLAVKKWTAIPLPPWR